VPLDSTEVTDGDDTRKAEQLESNFSRLNYVNKIQILLKALLLEREENRMNGLKI